MSVRRERVASAPPRSSTRRAGIRGHDGKWADVDARRQRILEVSARFFREKGFDNTRLDDVADELGVTRASFYYYFRSKQEILEAVYEQAMRDVEDIARVLDEDLPPIDKLRSFIVRMAEAVELPRGVFFREVHGLSPRFRRQLNQRMKALDHRLMDFLEDCSTKGVLDVRDVHVTAYTILGASNWVHVWFRADGAMSATAVGERMADQLLAGLLP